MAPENQDTVIGDTVTCVSFKQLHLWDQTERATVTSGASRLGEGLFIPIHIRNKPLSNTSEPLFAF